MPGVWLDGAVRRPGRNAGYAAGRNRLELGVLHFTVGTDSTSIGDQGYFHVLFPKVGPAIQFAEIDAVTWHAGGSSSMPDANQRGPGAEWERMPTGNYLRPGLQEADPLTPDQIEWGGRWLEFCEAHGIPKAHYPGPQFGAAGFAGHINHGDLDRDRSDGLTPEEWAAMTGPAPAPPTGDEAMQMVMVDFRGDTLTFHIDAAGNLKQNTYTFDKGQVLVDAVILDDNDPGIQPAVIVRSETVISLACVNAAGAGRYITYVHEKGWLDVKGKPLP